MVTRRRRETPDHPAGSGSVPVNPKPPGSTTTTTDTVPPATGTPSSATITTATATTRTSTGTRPSVITPPRLVLLHLRPSVQARLGAGRHERRLSGARVAPSEGDRGCRWHSADPA